MGYTSININYNEGTLCEEISFTEPGEQSYTRGSTITLSDARLSRDRQMIVMAVNYEEDQEGGTLTTVSGFSTEYEYTRKAPDCDVSFFTMTSAEYSAYRKDNPNPDSELLLKYGDTYGVGGWTMHDIVNKIVTEWMGLALVNNLPDYWISDFSISLGSTFFEAMSGLISEFEPFVILSGGTLYILERNGAGAFGAGQLTLTDMLSRSVNREYIPAPGCVRVEGGEGRYVQSKDPAAASYAYYGGGMTHSKEFSGTVTAPDGSKEDYSIIEIYLDLSATESVLISRIQRSRLTDSLGHTSFVQVTEEKVYDWNDIIESESEKCEAEIGDDLVVYNKVLTAYEHDSNLNLIGQITSKYELFIFDSDANTYVKYDPRDYNLADLVATESRRLIASEIRSTRYSEIDSETYGVETIIASKAYSEEEERWKTLYTFEHDIVEAGGQQGKSGTSSSEEGSASHETLQVYASDCPFLPNLAVMDEPAKVFSISTPDWDDIEDCYIYLSALVKYEFQTAQVTTPIIDPLPLMAIDGLGSILSSGISGSHYVTGYTINIDPNGYTTNLTLEARRA